MVNQLPESDMNEVCETEQVVERYLSPLWCVSTSSSGATRIEIVSIIMMTHTV